MNAALPSIPPSTHDTREAARSNTIGPDTKRFKMTWKKWLALPAVASFAGTGVSVLLHAVLIALGVLLIPPLRDAVVHMATPQDQITVPSIEIGPEVGGIQNPGLNADRTRPALQNIDSAESPSKSWTDNRSKTLDNTLNTAAAGETVPSVIGVGPKRVGENHGIGTGDASSNSLAPFGVPGGGSGLGAISFVGIEGKGNAERIVFICDGTGTMVTKKALLTRQLMETIAKLKPKQQYNVVFFSDGENCSSVDPIKLLNATPPNNRRTFAFLDAFAPQGKTNPIPAIERAFKMKPQLVFFLSDGAFDDLVPYEQVAAKFKELNQDKAARINTIVFRGTDEKASDLEKAADTMKQIARESGGNFATVDPIKLLTH